MTDLLASTTAASTALTTWALGLLAFVIALIVGGMVLHAIKKYVIRGVSGVVGGGKRGRGRGRGRR